MNTAAPQANNHQRTMNPHTNQPKRRRSSAQPTPMEHQSDGPVFVSPEGQNQMSLDTSALMAG